LIRITAVAIEGSVTWNFFGKLYQKKKIMIYGYIRVSTDRQTVENQRFEINNFCEQKVMVVDKWIEETISGTKTIQERKLGKLLKKMKKEDILICSELSRLGRNLLMIMGILNECMNRDIQVWTIKDNYRLGSDISSKVLAFAFGLSAEIERNLVSQRTKEALARMKSEGIHVGRPYGAKSKEIKLTGKEGQIKKMLKKKMSKVKIAKKLGEHRSTLRRFLQGMG
jgi:DNA invertase Pin-like site-specific DNA recombinase